MQHVTPEGVRSGDPGALAALCERRGAAVLAYCREVCEPADAPRAAAEALARFRAAVWAAGDAGDLDPERLLLSATRHAAAAGARTPTETSATRRMLGRGQTMTCARMPALIVARAENLLGSADLERLSRHLERCPICRATEAAFRRAERAYVATTHAPLDTSTTALFLGALAEAAPLDAPPDEVEPATEPPATEVLAPEPVEPVDPIEAEPAAEPLLDELDDPDEDGWAEDDHYDRMLEPGPATWNATEEPPRRRRGLRIAVPAVVLAAGAVAAMAIAGAFDGGGGSTATTTPRSTATTPAHTTTAKRTSHRKRATHPTTVTATP